MIIYSKNVLELLKNKGISSYYIRKNKIFGQQELQKIRYGNMPSWATLDTICNLLQCQPGDIIAWIPDPEQDHNSDTNTGLE